MGDGDGTSTASYRMFICELSLEDLRFDVAQIAGEGPVSSAVLQADVRFRRQGWSNHELAQFHRMIAILVSVGFAFETDCGVTDEGDPGLVFCEADSGEIFAHFARIDAGYFVCAPCLNQLLTGATLRQLVDSFIDRCSCRGEPRDEAGRRFRARRRRRRRPSVTRGRDTNQGRARRQARFEPRASRPRARQSRNRRPTQEATTDDDGTYGFSRDVVGPVGRGLVRDRM